MPHSALYLQHLAQCLEYYRYSVSGHCIAGLNWTNARRERPFLNWSSLRPKVIVRSPDTQDTSVLQIGSHLFLPLPVHSTLLPNTHTLHFLMSSGIWSNDIFSWKLTLATWFGVVIFHCTRHLSYSAFLFFLQHLQFSIIRYNLTFLLLFFAHLPQWKVSPTKSGIFPLSYPLQYPPHLEQCLICSRCILKICWMSNWMKEGRKQLIKCNFGKTKKRSYHQRSNWGTQRMSLSNQCHMHAKYYSVSSFTGHFKDPSHQESHRRSQRSGIATEALQVLLITPDALWLRLTCDISKQCV